MGLWDRLRGRGHGSGDAREGRAREARGDLLGAAEAFERAHLFDEAARALLAHVDVEPSLERRAALCERAARLARDEDTSSRATRRRARIALDLLRPRAALARSELARVAEQLEASNDPEGAAEAWALAGDRDGEIRALTAAGAIERLEARLAEDSERSSLVERRARVVKLVEDLDRTGERVRALEACASAGGVEEDPRLGAVERAIRVRLLRGRSARLELDGEAARVLLGDAVVVGRGDVALRVPSPALSREHLRVERGPDDAPRVVDLGSRNGTTLAGARLGGPLPVGAGLTLRLGGEIPCELRVGAGGEVRIEIAGESYLAPLGPLRLGGWTIASAPPPASIGGEPLIVLESTPESPAYLGEFEVARRIELGLGDSVSSRRGGPARLRVLGAGGGP